MAETVDAGDDARLVLRSRPPGRWLRRVSGILAVAVVAAWVVVTARGRPDPIQLVNLLLLTGWAVVLPLQGRGHRIELDRDDLVVSYPLRTRRIPYREITAVHGDVPTRLEWSTWLVVERRHGRAVTLPAVDMPISTLHTVLTRRVAAATPPPSGAPATGT